MCGGLGRETGSTGHLVAPTYSDALDFGQLLPALGQALEVQRVSQGGLVGYPERLLSQGQNAMPSNDPTISTLATWVWIRQSTVA